MKYQSWARLSAAIALVGLLSACSDSATAPARAPLAVAPVAAHTGDPSENDFNTFPGELWVCPDVGDPINGFIYKWSITDNATNLVVQSGVTKNITGGTCTWLASVPTTTYGRYTAWVREDPAGRYKISSIEAHYGLNFPNTPPPATIDMSGKAISDIISNDFGVVFTFYHTLQ